MDDREPAPSLGRSALRSASPPRGLSRLFAENIPVADRRPAWGLDFFDIGDGPAALLALGLGAALTLLAATPELSPQPPLWVHLLLWSPLASAGVVHALRLAETALPALEYRTGRDVWPGRNRS